MTRRVLGLDYYAAATHAPGIGRFGRELVRAWLRASDVEVDVALLEVGAAGQRLPESALGLGGEQVQRAPVHHVRARLPRRLSDAVAGLVGVERLLGGCDVFLRARPFAPHCRRAPSLWPVSQWPSEGAARERARFEAELAANDHLLVFAAAAAMRLVEEFGVAPERVHVIGVGADHWLRDAAPLDAPSEPRTLLVLGAVASRRHPEAVLEAFEALRERGSVERLVLVGRAGDGAEAFARRLGFSSARAHVTWIREPVERDLPALVASAALLVHVGAGEATPVTPLEGLAFGVPVVVSDTPEMREALGDHAAYLGESHPRRRGAALAELCAEQLAADGPQRRAAARHLSATFTWDRTARAVARVVEHLSARR